MQYTCLDSSAFRQLYHKHQTGAGLPEETIVDIPIPVFEIPQLNPGMSSSPPSATRPQRNKTIHSSDLTSVTEPGTTNQKRKRNRSFHGDATSTEVTTPGGGRPSAQDVYNLDNIMSPPRVVNRSSVMRLKIRDAEGNDNLETNMIHTRTPRRSKTISNDRGSQSSIVEQSQSLAKDDSSVRRRSNTASQNHDDQSTPFSLTVERQMSPIPSLAGGWQAIEQTATTSVREVNSTDPFIDRHVAHAVQGQTELLMHTGTSVPSPNIQVPHSNSDKTSSKENVSSGNVVTDRSSASGGLQVPHTLSTAGSDLFPIHQADAITHTSKTTSSLFSVVPNTLTASQKKEYKFHSMPSTASSGRSSLPDVMTVIDPNIKWSGNSSTVPNETPRSRASSNSVPTPGNSILSSPLVTTTSRKRQRSASLTSSVPVGAFCCHVHIRYFRFFESIPKGHLVMLESLLDSTKLNN